MKATAALAALALAAAGCGGVKAASAPPTTVRTLPPFHAALPPTTPTSHGSRVAATAATTSSTTSRSATLGTILALDSGDYPDSLDGMFEISFDFPSMEPPEYLQHLNPALYEEQCERVQSRFDEAVRLAEEAFTAELSKLLSHLTERVPVSKDGKPKIFRDCWRRPGIEPFWRPGRHLAGSSRWRPTGGEVAAGCGGN